MGATTIIIQKTAAEIDVPYEPSPGNSVLVMATGLAGIEEVTISIGGGSSATVFTRDGAPVTMTAAQPLAILPTGPKYIISKPETAGLVEVIGVPCSSRVVAAAESGEPVDALLAAALALSPVLLYDFDDPLTFFSDVGMTTYADANTTVAAILDKGAAGRHATQATEANRGILRGSPVGATLVSNGGFSGGTTDWTAALQSTLSVVSGALRVTATGATPLAQQGFATTVGRVYRVRAKYVGGTVTSPAFRVGSSFLANDLVNLSGAAAVATIDVYFTATSTTSYINFGATLATASEYSDWDDIEAHDVSADAVQAPYAIQMNGVNNYYETATIDLSGTDSATMITGNTRTKTSRGDPFGFGTTGTSVGSIGVRVPSSDGTDNVTVFARGTSLRSVALSGADTIGVPAIYTGIADTPGVAVSIRKNGAAGNTSANVIGGNFGTYAVHIGRRADGLFYFGGFLHGASFYSSALSGSSLASAEALVADRTPGVTL